jgi:cellulose synthase/poly-beta-1,6-N-acetylglucosamine synthase-like glycosyltransferase
MSNPKVTIAVPAYQAQDTIEKCLESLLVQDYPPDDMEIVIVDNRSTDNTASLVKKYPVKYVHEETRGVCFARNRALRESRGDFIAYTDSDCFAEKDWISQLARAFDDEKIGGVGGHVEPYPSNNLIEQYIAKKEILTQESMFRKKEFSPPFFITANVMYRTRILREIGGFDNFFTTAGEDADLSWRVAGAGYKLKLQPNAIVYHKHRSNLRKLCRMMFIYGVGTTALFKKYRAGFGKAYWIHTRAYKNVWWGFTRAPIHYLTKKDRIERSIPFLDGMNNLAFIMGKIYGSMKHGVLVL